jgi:hypothetical protein
MSNQIIFFFLHYKKRNIKHQQEKSKTIKYFITLYTFTEVAAGEM